MDQSSATIGLRLKELTDKTNELWEQMDKLWASAWRKNQSEIAKLRDDIKDINKQSTSFKSSLSALQTAVKGMPELERRVAELGALQAQIDKAVASAAGMASKVSSLEASVARSAGAQKDFEKRIATNEQWVESINAYRKQVNRRLEELQKLIAPSTPSAQPSLN
jgi:chromosome segregation ATPase